MIRLRPQDRVICIMGNDDWLEYNKTYTVLDAIKTGSGNDYLIELSEIKGMLWWRGRFKLCGRVGWQHIRETKRY